MTRGGQAGRARERQVATHLRNDDWVVMKGTTYGVCDLVALKLGARPKLIEVKSTAGGPYERFSPADRASLLAEADRAGADAVLAWWPPRGRLRFIPSSEWPTARPSHKACNQCGGTLTTAGDGVVPLLRCRQCGREVPATAMRNAA